jgi:hypothetical protein
MPSREASGIWSVWIRFQTVTLSSGTIGCTAARVPRAMGVPKITVRRRSCQVIGVSSVCG